MEETLPPQTEDGAGFEPTHVRQFTVFLENRVGRLQTLVRAYEGDWGRIAALDIQNVVDNALVRLICSDAEYGRDVLKNGGFAFTEQTILAVRLPPAAKQPLTAITSSLLTAEISIHYAYPLLGSPLGPALAICVDDTVLAAKVLLSKGFVLIGESDMKQ